MGCHPDDPANGQPSGQPYISFYTDDIQSTINELKAKGVEFIGEIKDKGYGLAIKFWKKSNCIILNIKNRHSHFIFCSHAVHRGIQRGTCRLYRR